MSPDVRDLLSDAVPPPRGADTEAILRRSRQIARRQRVTGGLAAAVLVPVVALGASQLADRDVVPPTTHEMTSSPGPSGSAGTEHPRGTVEVPPRGTARGALLDDGRRVVVSHAPNGDVVVLDIASPVAVRGFRQTLAWCESNRHLVDASSGAEFDMHGGPASDVSREFLTSYRTERVDDDTVRVVGRNDERGEATTFGEYEACTERPASLVTGPGSTSVSEAGQARPGQVVHVTGVIVVDDSGAAVMCDRVRAMRCLDGTRQPSEGTPVSGLPSVTRGRAVAGTFLVRRTDAGFGDVVRDANVDLQPPSRQVAYVHDMVRSGDAATDEGYLLTVDEGELLTGDSATDHTYDAGGEIPAGSNYVIVDDDRTRTQLRASDSATLYLLQKSAPPDFPQQVTAEEFRTEVLRRAAAEPMLVEIQRRPDTSGPQEVASIAEFFVP